MWCPHVVDAIAPSTRARRHDQCRRCLSFDGSLVSKESIEGIAPPQLLSDYKNFHHFINNAMSDKPEFILCSAYWFRDFPISDKALDCLKQSLPFNIESGVVLCGRNHLHPLRTMNVITGLNASEIGHHESGFLTSKNRFVGREEALKIAIAAGQIERGLYSQIELFSEDLFDG
jgi:hypothetical protein